MYCVKQRAAVSQKKSDWFWTDAEPFDEFFDFFYDKQLSMGPLIITLLPITKIGTPLLSYSYFVDFINALPCFECLKPYITLPWMFLMFPIVQILFTKILTE